MTEVFGTKVTENQTSGAGTGGVQTQAVSADVNSNVIGQSLAGFGKMLEVGVQAADTVYQEDIRERALNSSAVVTRAVQDQDFFNQQAPGYYGISGRPTTRAQIMQEVEHMKTQAMFPGYTKEISAAMKARGVSPGSTTGLAMIQAEEMQRQEDELMDAIDLEIPLAREIYRKDDGSVDVDAIRARVQQNTSTYEGQYALVNMLQGDLTRFYSYVLDNDASSKDPVAVAKTISALESQLYSIQAQTLPGKRGEEITKKLGYLLTSVSKFKETVGATSLSPEALNDLAEEQQMLLLRQSNDPVVQNYVALLDSGDEGLKAAGATGVLGRIQESFFMPDRDDGSIGINSPFLRAINVEPYDLSGELSAFVRGDTRRLSPGMAGFALTEGAAKGVGTPESDKQASAALTVVTENFDTFEPTSYENLTRSLVEFDQNIDNITDPMLRQETYEQAEALHDKLYDNTLRELEQNVTDHTTLRIGKGTVEMDPSLFEFNMMAGRPMIAGWGGTIPQAVEFVKRFNTRRPASQIPMAELEQYAAAKYVADNAKHFRNLELMGRTNFSNSGDRVIDPQSIAQGDVERLADPTDAEAFESVVAAGEYNQVAESMLPALIKFESAGDPDAVSGMGAAGLTQLLPSTALQPGYGVQGLQVDGVSLPTNWKTMTRDERTAWDKANVDIVLKATEAEQKRFATEYLGAMLRKYDGNYRKALAAYNWGPDNMDDFLAGKKEMPEVTKKYVDNIMAEWGGTKTTTVRTQTLEDRQDSKQGRVKSDGETEDNTSQVDSPEMLSMDDESIVRAGFDTMFTEGAELINNTLAYVSDMMFGEAEAKESLGTYTVQSGDSLLKIAKANGTTVDQLLEINPDIKNPNRIRVGQEINLGASLSDEDATPAENVVALTNVATAKNPALIAAQYLGIEEERDAEAVKTFFETAMGGDYFKSESPEDIAKKAWCAAFLSAVLNKDGSAKISGWDSVRTRSFENFGTRVWSAGQDTSGIKPGDVMLKYHTDEDRKENPSLGFGHVGIVTRVKGDDVFWIGGNTGDSVKEFSYNLTEEDIVINRVEGFDQIDKDTIVSTMNIKEFGSFGGWIANNITGRDVMKALF
jgi:LysM repeat protein